VVGFVEVIADAPAHGAAIEAESRQTETAPEIAVSDGVDAPRRHRCAKVAGVERPL